MSFISQLIQPYAWCLIYLNQKNSLTGFGIERKFWLNVAWFGRNFNILSEGGEGTSITKCFGKSERTKVSNPIYKIYTHNSNNLASKSNIIQSNS